MNKKDMLKHMMIKFRYGWKKHIIFLGIYIMFVIMSLFSCTIERLTKGNNSCIMLCAYMYGPLFLATAFSSIELSKSNYLVPFSRAERKKFLIFQNELKLISSVLMCIIYFILSIIVNPEIAEYSLLVMFMGGIPMSFTMAISGMDVYYKDDDKRKKHGPAYFYCVTGVSIIVGLGLACGIGVLSKNELSVVWVIIDVILCMGTIGYAGYIFVRFLKIDPIYDNINFDNIRLCKQSGYYLS